MEVAQTRDAEFPQSVQLVLFQGSDAITNIHILWALGSSGQKLIEFEHGGHTQTYDDFDAPW